MAKTIIGQVLENVRQALIPRRPNQKEVVWAIRFLVGIVLLAAMVVAILVWASKSGFVTQNNAAVVAALLALTGVLIAQIVNASLARSAQRHQQDLEAQRARAAALQTYLEQMGNLLTDGKLRKSEPDYSAKTVAQAQTIATLKWMDADRRGIILQFLYNSDLINKEQATISLAGADLSEANLPFAELSKASLSGATLTDADLREANLDGADLRGADLRGAKLNEASLIIADLGKLIIAGGVASLGRTDLSGTHLSGANLIKAKNLTQEQIQEANGDENTKLPNGIQRPDHWAEAAKE